MSSKVTVKSLGQANSTQQNRRSAIAKLNKLLKRNGYREWKELYGEQGEAMFCSSVTQYEEIATFFANECLPQLPQRKKDAAIQQQEQRQRNRSAKPDYKKPVRWDLAAEHGNRC